MFSLSASIVAVRFFILRRVAISGDVFVARVVHGLVPRRAAPLGPVDRRTEPGPPLTFIFGRQTVICHVQPAIPGTLKLMRAATNTLAAANARRIDRGPVVSCDVETGM